MVELVSAAGALKARVPIKPIRPVAAANNPPVIPGVGPTEDGQSENENAGYMVAGG